MATTTANKHGLRKAAQERTNRHAQRTPLPPKPGVVEGAREVIDSLSSIQADLVDEAVAKATESHGDAPDVRSWGKAKEFARKAEEAKWEVSLEPQGESVELTATRGAETIVQAWTNGVWQYPASFYAHGDRNTKPRNASGAAKLLTRSPEDAAAEAGKVASNKHFRKAEPKDIGVKLEEAKRHLPFDPDLAPDELILGALTGQALVWYNRLSRGTERAMVSRKGARMSLTPEGQRVVTFCCPATGYRSCLVTAILKVGRGRVSATKGQEFAEIEVED
jgi:hypothetical protein